MIVDDSNYRVYGLMCECSEVCLSKGVRYVGLTTQDQIEKRLGQHRANARNRKAPVYDWMRKHGPENITIHLILAVETIDELNLWESAIIKFMKSRWGLLNYIDGGGFDNATQHPEVMKKVKARLYEFHGSSATHCKRGHELDEETLYIDNSGHRYCRKCKRDRLAQKRREAGIPIANKYKTHCIRGHEFNDENTGRDKNGYRRCLACIDNYKKGPFDFGMCKCGGPVYIQKTQQCKACYARAYRLKKKQEVGI